MMPSCWPVQRRAEPGRIFGWRPRGDQLRHEFSGRFAKRAGGFPGCGIALYAPAGRVRSIFGDAGNCEGFRVGPARVAVRGLHVSRPVVYRSSNCSFRGCRRGKRVDPSRRPSPRAGPDARGEFRISASSSCGVLRSLRLHQTHAHAAFHQMRVGIVEAGKNHAASQIDDLRRWSASLAASESGRRRGFVHPRWPQPRPNSATRP